QFETEKRFNLFWSTCENRFGFFFCFSVTFLVNWVNEMPIARIALGPRTRVLPRSGHFLQMNAYSDGIWTLEYEILIRLVFSTKAVYVAAPSYKVTITQFYTFGKFSFSIYTHSKKKFPVTI